MKKIEILLFIWIDFMCVLNTKANPSPLHTAQNVESEAILKLQPGLQKDLYSDRCDPTECGVNCDGYCIRDAQCRKNGRAEDEIKPTEEREKESKKLKVVPSGAQSFCLCRKSASKVENSDCYTYNNQPRPASEGGDASQVSAYQTCQGICTDRVESLAPLRNFNESKAFEPPRVYAALCDNRHDGGLHRYCYCVSFTYQPHHGWGQGGWSAPSGWSGGHNPLQPNGWTNPPQPAPTNGWSSQPPHSLGSPVPPSSNPPPNGWTNPQPPIVVSPPSTPSNPTPNGWTNPQPPSVGSPPSTPSNPTPNGWSNPQPPSGGSPSPNGWSNPTVVSMPTPSNPSPNGWNNQQPTSGGPPSNGWTNLPPPTTVQTQPPSNGWSGYPPVETQPPPSGWLSHPPPVVENPPVSNGWTNQPPVMEPPSQSGWSLPTLVVDPPPPPTGWTYPTPVVENPPQNGWSSNTQVSPDTLTPQQLLNGEQTPDGSTSQISNGWGQNGWHSGWNSPSNGWSGNTKPLYEEEQVNSQKGPNSLVSSSSPPKKPTAPHQQNSNKIPDKGNVEPPNKAPTSPHSLHHNFVPPKGTHNKPAGSSSSHTVSSSPVDMEEETFSSNYSQAPSKVPRP